MKFNSYFDGKTKFSQIFLGFVFYLFFLGGGGGGGGGGEGRGGGGWTNHRIFHLWLKYGQVMTYL